VSQGRPSISTTITFACANYDRVRPIADGRIAVEGCTINFLPVGPEEVFFRAFRYADFDVSELSLNSHSMVTARGQNAYIGIPVFPSRLFRHSSFYIRTDRGIRSPQDLKGRLVGVPEYQQTANVWVRGMLEEDYGVKPSDLKWRSGGAEEPGRDERTPLVLPDGIDLQPIPRDKTLSGMLAAGELDAFLTARAPSVYLHRAPNIGRLFPDFRAVEQDYFRRTRHFPIMHLIGIRRDIVARHPWLPANLFRALVAAKALAIRDLEESLVDPAITLPWSEDILARTRTLMGRNFWAYGLAENRHDLTALLRYSHAQGLCARLVAPEELFDPSTHALPDVHP